MIKEGGTDGTAAPASIIVVQHWVEELKRLVPTKQRGAHRGKPAVRGFGTASEKPFVSFVSFVLLGRQQDEGVRSTDRPNAGRRNVPAILPAKAAGSQSHPCRLPEAMPLK